MQFANTPEPPYYAVIFTSQHSLQDIPGYQRKATEMVLLAAQQPGFLGIESARDSTGLGITVSYWSSMEAIRNWKQNSTHKGAQEKGQSDWYSQYSVRIARVDRDYSHGL